MAKTNQRNDLGKGIRALLGEINTDIENDNLQIDNVQKKMVNSTFLELQRIEVNPFQPRLNFNEEALEELANSIRIHGIIQPLTVREIDKNKFQLISGERRLRASKLAGLEKVPVYIRTANDQEALEMALIENIQREELNAIEIGLNYQRLLDDCELNHEQLAERLGKNRTTITNFIRLLKLPPDIQVAVREDKLSMGHARALVGVENIDIQLDIFNQVIDNELNVRQTEAMVNSKSNKIPKTKKTLKNNISNEIRILQDTLCSELSTKVVIKESNGRGTINIPFHDEEELLRLTELIKH